MSPNIWGWGREGTNRKKKPSLTKRMTSKRVEHIQYIPDEMKKNPNSAEWFFPLYEGQVLSLSNC